MMDKGPWYATNDLAHPEDWSEGPFVISEDFEHDVLLRIEGDFAPGDKEKYATWLAGRLNLPAPPDATGSKRVEGSKNDRKVP